jgi:intron-binding protein aquarius
MTAQTLWDEHVVPSDMFTDGCLALPKLNIQFLTMFDYLLRNLNLFHMESTYEIRQVSREPCPWYSAYFFCCT